MPACARDYVCATVFVFMCACVCVYVSVYALTVFSTTLFQTVSGLVSLPTACM